MLVFFEQSIMEQSLSTIAIDPHALVVCDEASGVDDTVFDSVSLSRKVLVCNKVESEYEQEAIPDWKFRKLLPALPQLPLLSEGDVNREHIPTLRKIVLGE
jgi:hypothetical protein